MTSTTIAAPTSVVLARPQVGGELATLEVVAATGDAVDDGGATDSPERSGRSTAKTAWVPLILRASSMPSVTAGLMWQPLIGPIT